MALRRLLAMYAVSDTAMLKLDIIVSRSSAVFWLMTVVCCWSTLLSARTVDATSEKRLITMLLENYRQNGVDGRPVLNTSATLPVAISFSLVQILHFDPVANVITLVGWSSLRWRDVLLRWNAYEFDNIRQVVLRPDQIWTPDVVLFNAISPPRIIHDTRLIVAQNGDVLWTTHAQYQLTCMPAAGSSAPLQPSPPVPQPPAAWPRGGGGHYGGSGSTSATPTECQLRFGSWTLSADLLRLQSIDQSSSIMMSSSVAVAGSAAQSLPQSRGRLLSPLSSSSSSVSSASASSASSNPGPLARDRSFGSASPQSTAATGDAYVPNADWDLTSLTVVNHEVEYPCCPGRRYADVTYSFRLARRVASSSSFRGQQGPRDIRSKETGHDLTMPAAGRRNIGRPETDIGAGLTADDGPDNWSSAVWPEVESEPRFAASSAVYGRRHAVAVVLMPLTLLTSAVYVQNQAFF